MRKQQSADAKDVTSISNLDAKDVTSISNLDAKAAICGCGSHPQRVKISRHQFSRISAKINQKSAVSFVKSAVSPSANSARGKAKNIISFAKSGGGQSAMSAARIANSGRQGENP